MAAAIAHTIAVVDKSGKVVNTSKQLKNVFMEAKFAYQERKAEIVAERKAKTPHNQNNDLRRAMVDMRIEDSRSERSSGTRRSHSSAHRHHDSERRSRPESLGRHHSSSSVSSRREHDISPGSPSLTHSHSRSHSRSPKLGSTSSRSAPTSPSLVQHPPRRSLELVRRRTDMDVARTSPTRPPHLRSASLTAIDMDLAYGDYHPSSIAPLSPTNDNKELLTLVDRAKLLLDEANCAQHSVKAMIEHLQKNPDAMAAVALTLAEISNIASKMAPGALAALKGSAPAVFALLASPQFLIAAGVGIGVTVVMLGGYKIIKKIKAKNAAEKEGSMDEMMEVDPAEISRINQWRRGIVLSGDEAGSQVGSVGTSVDGEFITPLAASMRGMETREDLGLSEKERKKRDKKLKKEGEKERKRESKKGKKVRLLSDGRSEASSINGGKSDTASRTSSALSTLVGEEGTEGRRRAVVKVKKPSPLRRLLA